MIFGSLSRRLIFFILAFWGLSIFCVSANAEYIDDDEVDASSCYRIGIVTEQEDIDASEQWMPVVDYLNTNIKDQCFAIRYFKPSYSLSAIKAKEADFLFMSPVVYSELEHHVLIDTYLSMERLQGGMYYSRSGATVFTRPEQKDINVFKDLKHKKVIVFKSEDMRGELAFERELVKLHVDPKKAFKKYILTENKKDILSSVLRKEYDAGVLATGDLEDLVAKGACSWKDLKIIEPYKDFQMKMFYGVSFRYSTDLYADWIFVSIRNIQSQIVRDVVGALLKMPPHKAGFGEVWRPAYDYHDVHDALWDLKRGSHNLWHIQNSLARLWSSYGWLIVLILFIFVSSLILAIYLLINNFLLRKSKSELSYRVFSQKEIEAGVQETEARIEAILNAIPYAVIGFENDTIIFVNGAVKKIFGWDPENLLGKTAEMLYSGEHYINLIKEIYLSFKKDQVLCKEISAQRKNGEHFDCLVNIAQTKTVGIDHRFVGVFIDVSNQYQQEELLKKLSKAVEQNPVGVLIVSYLGKVEYVNDSFAHITGLEHSHIMSSSAHKILSELFLYSESKDLWNSIVTAQLTQKEFLTQRKNGEQYWAALTVSLLKNLEGSVSYIVFNWDDISERKKAEDQLRKSQQEVERVNASLLDNEKALKTMIQDLESTHNQLKTMQTQLIQTEKLSSIGQLAAGIAHEINNPIAFINSNMDALERYLGSIKKIFDVLHEYDRTSKDEVDKFHEAFAKMSRIKNEENIDFILKDIDDVIHESKEGLERIKNIVIDLKTFSRRDDSSRVFADLNQILEGVINIVWNEIRYKAKLTKNFQKISLVNCNPQQLGQVFINLLINAIQAIPEKGEIVLSTYEKNGFAVVEISDTGSGIPDNVRPYIFEPFFTTKKAGESTGLGLSISLEIITRHQGKIDVKSKVGEGTTFYVYLPLSK
ncbi:MAG: PAS domain S-box protein [Candidatus Omnitrophica bacterium]|nr:PAS domain S-box protein [Candidatus Omnitrophota bacterium]